MAEFQQEWLQAARKGDQDAFGKIVEAFQIPVFNLCYRMLGDPSDAEDAAQESFWRAHQGLHRYDPQRSFPTWLLSIAAHYCIDRLRRKRLTLISLEDLLPTEDVPDPADNPERETGKKQDQEAVQTMLDILRPEERAMIVMRYWYDMSYEEIGKSMSVSVSAVKSRLHRTRRALADHHAKTSRSTLRVGGHHE